MHSVEEKVCPSWLVGVVEYLLKWWGHHMKKKWWRINKILHRVSFPFAKSNPNLFAVPQKKKPSQKLVHIFFYHLRFFLSYNFVFFPFPQTLRLAMETATLAGGGLIGFPAAAPVSGPSPGFYITAPSPILRAPIH